MMAHMLLFVRFPHNTKEVYLRAILRWATKRKFLPEAYPVELIAPRYFGGQEQKHFKKLL